MKHFFVVLITCWVSVMVSSTGTFAQEKTSSPGKVLLDNERVKVSETKVKPGEKNEMKMRDDRVTVPMGPAKFRFHYPDGKTEDIEYKTGTPIFRKKGMSQAENIGSTESHSVIINLK
jgi:hypothetical protein